MESAENRDSKGVVVVIQARMSSSRLPGKIALPAGDKTVLTYLIARLKSALSFPVFVATSENSADDLTAEMAESQGVAVVRGSEENVFSRFQKAARHCQAEHLVRLTADDPLVDVSIIKKCVDVHLQRLPDLTSTREIKSDRSIVRYVSKGASVDVLKAKTLLSIDAADLDDFQKEHVIPVFYDKSKKYKVEVVKKLKISAPVISIDTLKDYRDFLQMIL